MPAPSRKGIATALEQSRLFHVGRAIALVMCCGFLSSCGRSSQEQNEPQGHRQSEPVQNKLAFVLPDVLTSPILPSPANARERAIYDWLLVHDEYLNHLATIKDEATALAAVAAIRGLNRRFDAVAQQLIEQKIRHPRTQSIPSKYEPARQAMREKEDKVKEGHPELMNIEAVAAILQKENEREPFGQLRLEKAMDEHNRPLDELSSALKSVTAPVPPELKRPGKTPDDLVREKQQEMEQLVSVAEDKVLALGRDRVARIHITNRVVGPDSVELVRALMKASGAKMQSTRFGAEGFTFTIGPVEDFDAFVKKLDLGKIVEVNKAERLIKLQYDPAKLKRR